MSQSVSLILAPNHNHNHLLFKWCSWAQRYTVRHTVTPMQRSLYLIIILSRGDMDFPFSCSTQYLTRLLRSLVTYRVEQFHINTLLTGRSRLNSRFKKRTSCTSCYRSCAHVYSYVQTRLKGQYNGKWPFSLVYVLKPLITPIRAINSWRLSETWRVSSWLAISNAHENLL